MLPAKVRRKTIKNSWHSNQVGRPFSLTNFIVTLHGLKLHYVAVQKQV